MTREPLRLQQKVCLIDGDDRRVFECGCFEKNQIISVRDIKTKFPLRGGDGMFHDEHDATKFRPASDDEIKNLLRAD